MERVAAGAVLGQQAQDLAADPRGDADSPYGFDEQNYDIINQSPTLEGKLMSAFVRARKPPR